MSVIGGYRRPGNHFHFFAKIHRPCVNATYPLHLSKVACHDPVDRPGVIGEYAKLTLRPAHAFYRVVAIDREGKRSGPSEFVAAPLPFIFSEPLTTAVTGKPYEYRVQSIVSIGDLRSLPRSRTAYWNTHTPEFSLVEGPAWLTMDATSGKLHGTPTTAGTYPIRIQAAIKDVKETSTQTFQLVVKLQ